MKILFLSRWFPYPADNGAKLRIYHLLRGLAQVHDVHLVSFADDPQAARIAELQTFCQDVRAIAWNAYQPNSMRSLLGLFSRVPRVLVDTYSSQMEQEIRQLLDKESFDLVILSEWQMTTYRHLFHGVPVLLEEIEVGVPYDAYINAGSLLKRVRNGLTWWKYRDFLTHMLSNDTLCTVVSEREQKLLVETIPHRCIIYVIPNGVDLAEYSGVYRGLETESLIFCGSFRYLPNYQAMLWFLEEVFPRIQEQVPGVTLTITGDSDGLSLPQCKGVNQTGYVDDVKPLIAGSCISVVPLRVGGGTRLKILESMALHTPVVSTSKGAEGLDFRAGEHLMIADTAETFASQVVDLMKSPSLRERITSSAWQLVHEQYDWQVILPDFLKVVRQAAESRVRGQR